MIHYNYRGKEHTIKTCTTASRAVYKKLERKIEVKDKWKKRMNIIDNDRYSKLANVERTLGPTPEPALKSLIPELMVVDLTLD